jgi:iron(III) transport system substrate-binding protein
VSIERRGRPNPYFAATLLIALLSACRPAPAPAASHSSQPAPQTASSAAVPQGSDALLAAAKPEGVVSVSGPVGSLWREALAGFEQRYPEVQFELTPLNSRDFWPRVSQERQGGQYLWDVRVGGLDPLAYRAKAEGLLDPVRPAMLPEVADDRKWIGGLDSGFADKDKQYFLGFLMYALPGVYVNRDVVSESDFRSAEDLLDPRWRGRIVLQDPRAGQGLVVLQAFLEGYGEDFVRRLLSTQDVVVTGDVRQQAEWVVRGRYPIAIALKFDELVAFEQAGLQFRIETVPQKLGAWTSGFGAVALMNRAPHPNAAKLFINWLLSQDAQSRIAKTVVINSRRTDVEPGDPARTVDPARLGEFLATQDEDQVPSQTRVLELVRELVK